MVTYSPDKETALCNGIKFRRDKVTGYYLSTSYTDSGRRERLHVYIWRVNNGNIPKGYHINHKDGDKFNNELDNLEMLTSKDHAAYHGQNMSEEQKKQATDRLINMAVPKASEWHKSKEGHEWDVKHGQETFRNLRYIDCICEQCGNPYKAKENTRSRSKYCSNRCKAAARRESGIDNEERICAGCGDKFLVNKYSLRKYCSADCKRTKTA